MLPKISHPPDPCHARKPSSGMGDQSAYALCVERSLSLPFASASTDTCRLSVHRQIPRPSAGQKTHMHLNLQFGSIQPCYVSRAPIDSGSLMYLIRFVFHDLSGFPGRIWNRTDSDVLVRVSVLCNCLAGYHFGLKRHPPSQTLDPGSPSGCRCRPG